MDPENPLATPKKRTYACPKVLLPITGPLGRGWGFAGVWGVALGRGSGGLGMGLGGEPWVGPDGRSDV